MPITNSVVCGRRKGCTYKQIKPPLVGEHAFPLTEFVCIAANVILAYCSLRKLVPQDDSSREEALLVGGVRSPDLVEARVVASSHASRWSQVRLYWYVDYTIRVRCGIYRAKPSKISALL